MRLCCAPGQRWMVIDGAPVGVYPIEGAEDGNGTWCRRATGGKRFLVPNGTRFYTNEAKARASAVA